MYSPSMCESTTRGRLGVCVALLAFLTVAPPAGAQQHRVFSSQQQLYETCSSYSYRMLDVNLKMEHQCLLMHQIHNELYTEREDRIRRHDELNVAITRLNKKLNYLIQDFKPEFIDPFETSDNQVLYNALMDVSDGQGRNWKLVKLDTIDKLESAARRKEEECRMLPTYQPNVDMAPLPQDCYELRQRGVRTNGVYPIRLFSGAVVLVYCDMRTDGGGWTVIQKRGDGSANFNRNWTDYREGFGNVNSEHWLGLEHIHLLVTNRNSSLRVDLWDWQKNHAHAYYSTLHVGGERDSNYTLTVHGYKGDAGDALSYHSGCKFSTPDRDNDQWADSCAQQVGAGWWFKGCSYAVLNTKYYNMRKARNRGLTIVDGIMWYHWKEDYGYTMRRAEMKTRPTFIET